MTLGDWVFIAIIAYAAAVAGYLLFHVIARARERRRLRKYQRQLAFLIGDLTDGRRD